MPLTTFYIPSWHGDFRFQADEKDVRRTIFTVEKPTLVEQEAIRRWGKKARKKFSVEEGSVEALVKGDLEQLIVDAAVPDVAGLMASILNFKRAGVLTALKFESGEVKATEVLHEDGLPSWAKKLVGEKEAETKKPEPAVAATVKRPSMSCPECSGRKEADRKACDVLWAFLDEDQRKEWLARRSFTVFGGRTGFAYRLAPRDSALAAKVGRPCFDLDNRCVLHNYQLDVPPEEELLALKLMLELCEHWIRIQGEVDPVHRAKIIFPEPFPNAVARGTYEDGGAITGGFQ